MINRQKNSYLCAKCEDKPHLGIKKQTSLFYICSRLALSLHLKYKDIQRFNEDI